MSLRSICVEVRKNLHCANVFLQFDQSLTETEFLKINVHENELRLRELTVESRADVSEHFSIEAQSISNLTVEECNASFRLEIDKIQEDEPTPPLNPPADAKPSLKEGDTAALLCSNCECRLFTGQVFQRIREFPSGSIDVSEFFCHHGPDLSDALVPKETDFFYGFQFVVISANLLQSTTKSKDQHFYCARCLQYLGEALFAGKAAKLWADGLRLEEDDEVGDIFNLSASTPTCQLLLKIIRETSTGAEPMLHQVHFSKVLLEATFSNRQSKFLLLHILEKQLRVLRNEQPLAFGSTGNNNNVVDIRLKMWKCFKLLYRLTTEEKAVEEVEDTGDGCKSGQALLTEWQNDISIPSIKVSPKLFRDLLAELEENALILPALYRNTRDSFQLSYVFYED